MTSFTAIITTLAIPAFLLLHMLGAPAAISIVIFAVATMALAILLARCYTLVPRLEGAESRRILRVMRAHILLHLVPVSYLIGQFFIEMTLLMNSLYLAPMLLFFYTARVTWRSLHERFGAKMYLFYQRGSTGMFLPLSVLIGLGWLHKPEIGGTIFCRVMLIYFTIHLLMTGIAVFRIERDVIGVNPKKPPASVSQILRP